MATATGFYKRKIDVHSMPKSDLNEHYEHANRLYKKQVSQQKADEIYDNVIDPIQNYFKKPPMKRRRVMASDV